MKLGSGSLSKDDANRRIQELEQQLEEAKESAQQHLSAVLAEVAEELDAERAERKQLQEAHDALLSGTGTGETAPRGGADAGSSEALAHAEERLAELEASLQASTEAHEA